MNPLRKLYPSVSKNKFAVAGFLIWSVIMIGLGNKAPDFGVLQVQAGAKEACLSNGIQLIVDKTSVAINKFNWLVKDGKQRVAALFHITC